MAVQLLSCASHQLRVLFVVQGEGRGHLTQALALGAMLQRAGHEVVEALVGTSGRRDVPAFFREGLASPVGTIEAPAFSVHTDGRIRPAATALDALRRAPAFRTALDRLGDVVDQAEPDVVVNFFEGLVGAYVALRGLDAPLVAVGHQFMMGHPEYPLQPGQPGQRLALRAYTRLAGTGANTRLALSFYDAPPADGLRVAPPLLRRALFALADTPGDGSVVVYLMDPARAADLAAWSDRRPDVRLHCFSDVPPHAHSPALTFHGLAGQPFLDHMARARGVVCTAGFESVSEAMWLGTPALMVPTPGHYEQRCNAADASAAGAGRASVTLDLDAFLDDLEHGPVPDPAPFRAWVARAEREAVRAVEAAAGLTAAPRASSATVAQAA